eukprot:TRINITY_DN449_c0_g1_i1.p1 TRINITY_DN449_c0_g1~~TRINITY_DN449_c0_g1_i1.p1  ORF type:complete len:440 (+),score=129.98 TRINITY_DN449_c0_g1_i1:86-1405(+)
MVRAGAVLLALLPGAAALDDGLALRPPMGWRSWNCYGGDVTQDKMQAVMDQMAARTRSVDGKPTSLADLGYINCGLDDAWQACGTGKDGSFHDANGHPLINKTRFPDMKAMTDHAHSKGLHAGWYMNNCICRESAWALPGSDNYHRHMNASAAAVAQYGFDSVKLDGCGEFLDLTLWAQLLNATGRKILIENCHWGCTTPSGKGDFTWQCPIDIRPWPLWPTQKDGKCDGTEPVSKCPYHFYRTSHDIKATWESMFGNLQTTIPFQGDPPLSRPGAWAYPDMLEVGRLANEEEDRAHFAAWCIVSSPLVLGHDLLDQKQADRVWNTVSNTEAIAVNQAWAGHPGRLVRHVGGSDKSPGLQLWAKPLGGGSTAAVVINNACSEGDCAVTIDLAADLGLPAGQFKVRDIWARADNGTATGTFATGPVGLHGSRFLRFDPAA